MRSKAFLRPLLTVVKDAPTAITTSTQVRHHLPSWREWYFCSCIKNQLFSLFGGHNFIAYLLERKSHVGLCTSFLDYVWRRRSRLCRALEVLRIFCIRLSKEDEEKHLTGKKVKYMHWQRSLLITNWTLYLSELRKARKCFHW